MATVPAVAYLGDRYQRNEYLNEWTFPVHRLADFQQGRPGEIAQNGKDGNTYTDGFDAVAHNSTYSTEMLFNGRQVCKCFCPQGTFSKNGGWGGSFTKDIKIKAGERAWSRALVWLPPKENLDIDQTIQGGGSMKFMRWTVAGIGHVDIYISGQDIGYSSWWHLNSEPMTAANSPAPQVGRRYFGQRNGSFDQYRQRWLDVQYCVVFHKTPKSEEDGLAEVFFWINGERVGHTTTAWTMNGDDEIVDESLFMTYINVDMDTGVDEDWHLYCAEYEVTNITPSTTDALGYPMLASKV